MSRWTRERSQTRATRNRSLGIDDAEIAELVRRLKELPDYIGSDVQALLKYAAEPTLNQAIANAPDTKNEKTIAWEGGKASEGGGLKLIPAGDLKRNIRFLKFPRMRKNMIIGVRLRSRAKSGMVGTYAHHVEFGNSKMAARPFMRPAFDATKPQVIRRLGEAIARHIRPWQTRYARTAR